MKKYLLLLLPIITLGGCLQDNIDMPQVVPRPIYPPGGVYYTCITNTLNLQIRWNPPQVDTQNNFKGYFVELFQSDGSGARTDDIDSLLISEIDSVHVLKIDTQYTFIGKVVQGGRYTIRIYGERVPDPAKPDSLVLSASYIPKSFYFDSQPVLAPDSLFASSGGTNTINLFWRQSLPSETHIGFAGYVIRYKDPDNTAAKLLYAGRQQIDSNASQLIRSIYYKFPVNVSGNPQPPAEKEYTFWIKAIRKDSVESADSVSITWSGAERLPGLTVRLDTGVFIGITGSQYGIAQLPIGNTANPQFKISQVNGSVVVSQVDNATMFVNRVDRDTNFNLFETNFFGKPFPDADFDQTQISFPAQGPDNSAMVYVKFPQPGNNRARILFSKLADTTHTNTGSYIRDSTITIQASFQPIGHPQLPFF